ncbi:hypothetical protein [Neotabrizicola sp. VNH66]|uniref:hypothetical protein n=1 Tax=Neotabrizicola sp. VNH66 TaxID=3400918 RepID=UPI003C0CBB0E
MILANQVWEHIDRPYAATKNVLKMLKRGGWFFSPRPSSFPAVPFLSIAAAGPPAGCETCWSRPGSTATRPIRAMGRPRRAAAQSGSAQGIAGEPPDQRSRLSTGGPSKGAADLKARPRQSRGRKPFVSPLAVPANRLGLCLRRGYLHKAESPFQFA